MAMSPKTLLLTPCVTWAVAQPPQILVSCPVKWSVRPLTVRAACPMGAFQYVPEEQW